MILENQDKKQLILSYLEEGLLKKDAAALAGINESTFYRWVESDASFASQVQVSVLKYKRSLIQDINTSTKKDGRLALEILRRRWPNDGFEEDDTQRSTKRIAELVQAIYDRHTDENGIDLTREHS
jgi:transposase-like protein